ncbi:MAG: signal peptide peptidase SppA [Candidatus Omnitrophota bacterium]
MKKGLLIAILVLATLIILLALGAGYMYLQLNREPDIPQHAFLQIDLSGYIPDIDMAMISKKVSFNDLWYHIERAKIDSRIKGIILRISYMNTGFARLDDIGRVINDFKRSGKKVYAFLEGGGIDEYYIASFADKVCLFKGGNLFLKGLATETVFLKKTLALLGIQAEFIHIGEYKTAANMFTEQSMTPSHKESIEKVVNDVYDSTLKTIAVNRKLTVEGLKKICEDSPTDNRFYLDAKLVDAICYEDEILKDNSEAYATVSFDTYQDTSSPLPYEGSDKIGVIFACGQINARRSGIQSLFGYPIMGSDTVSEQLQRMRTNPAIKAIVLRVDSPGGSASASDMIRREVELTARVKPVVVSMSDLAASGGYLIACASSKVLALPQTLTGSIGVLSGKFVLKGLYDKLGISKEVVKTTGKADMFSDYRLYTPEERKLVTEVMEQLYKDFVGIVAKSRHLRFEDAERIARGRVWSGATAQTLHLVDETGGLTDAIHAAKTLAHIPLSTPIGIVTLPKKKTFFEQIMDLVESKFHASESLPLETLYSQIDGYKTFFPAFMIPYKFTFE